MNTKFFLYIFALLTTGTVLAHDVHPIVREALTQEELQNAQEGKSAVIRTTTRTTGHIEEGDKEKLVEALKFALKNDKTGSILLDQLSQKQKPSDKNINTTFELLIHGFAMVSLAATMYVIGHKMGYHRGYNRYYNENDKETYWRGFQDGVIAGLKYLKAR